MIQALAPNIHLLSEREAKEVQDSLQNVPATAQWKVSTPPAVTHELSALNTEGALFYPAVGLSFLSIAEPPGEQIEGIRTAVRKHGGSAVILRPYTAHTAGDVWGPPGPELSLMRKVKDVFDPERVMSPGRFVGHL